MFSAMIEKCRIKFLKFAFDSLWHRVIADISAWLSLIKKLF